jgi:Icc-related predicted phosphoesterase
MKLLSARSRARRSKGGRSSATETLSLYYASDIHGSERCWRKFLRAASFYDVETLIMGGDLTGKAVVPVVRGEDGGHEARVLGETRKVTTDAELEQLLETIRFSGMYPWLTDRAQVDRHAADAELRGALFDEVMGAELRRWVALADERLAEGTTSAYVMAGNDDPWFVDEILETGERVRACGDRIVRVGEHEMLSCSYANPTPWNSPRELDEDALYERLRALAEQLERPETAIFNLHVPPHDSGLDLATKIDENFKVVLEGGTPTEVPVGSTAVRQIIEEFQPILALHGHIHESRAETWIGRTLAINSGSEYNTGRIHGVVVRLAGPTVTQHQFVIG